MEEKKDKFYGMARPEIRDLTEYNPGPMPEDCLRISANENNTGVSPKAMAAMTAAMTRSNRYPDSTCTSLREKIAEHYGLLAEQILVGNGLDGVFTNLGRAFLSHGDEVVCAELTFSVYEDTAKIMGAVPVKVPMTDDMTHDVDGFINAMTDKTKFVCFCNPNNPSGTAVSLDEIERAVKATPAGTFFILDEAYIDFADGSVKSGLALLERYPNLIVCRTFSKIFGLAGMRVGWIAADPEILRYMYKTREPYCVGRVAAAGAEAALDDADFYENSLRVLTAERVKLAAFLADNGIKFTPSQGNFIMVDIDDAGKVRERLAKRHNIAVRLAAFRGRHTLRISVGLPEENLRLERALLEEMGR